MAEVLQGRELTAFIEEPVELALPSAASGWGIAPAPVAEPGFAPYSAAAQYGQVASSPYERLVGMIKRPAKTYAPNYDLGEGMWVASFAADGGALVLKTNIAPKSNPANVSRIICANPGMQSVMVNGGTVAVSFGTNDLRLTRQACGI